MLFPQALKMMMLKKFFFQFIFGVFFQSLHPNGCLEARIAQAKLFLGGTVALKQITLAFLDPATISLIFWDDDVVSKQKSEHKHNTPKFSPSFPQVFPKFSTFPQVSKGCPKFAWASYHPHPSGGSVGGQEAYLEVIDPNVTWGFARKKKRMGPGDSK